MKKALLFLSLVALFGFAGCVNDKSDDDTNENEIFEISYDIEWYKSDAAATDIVIFELDGKRNVVRKQDIPYIPRCGMNYEHRTLNSTSNVTQVEIYHKSMGRCYFTYREIDHYQRTSVPLSDNQITQEQYNNAIH